MGMFLSKYSMLNALGYGADKQILDETKKILNRFKLFGLILHDPINNVDFHNKFSQIFERLDFLTGHDFLFFGLTDPPKKWIEKNDRDYFGIWETDKLLSKSNSYITDDNSVSAYTIAQSLNIDYDDLPVIILTNNFQFNQYRVIKTCPKFLEQQMTEIGYFCSQKEHYFNLVNDSEFNNLINSVDLCGGSFQISNEESLAKTLSDFLAFIIYENKNSHDIRLAEIQIGNVINKFLTNKELQNDPKRIEQLNLFILGCLSNIKSRNSDFVIELDERCEPESKIILKTFNKVFPFFEPFNQRLKRFQQNSNVNQQDFNKQNEIDFSPLILSLCKIFEIETNLSIVHWIRSSLKIEMPKYFKKHKDSIENYTLTPSKNIVSNPRPIDFNKGYGRKWIAPGIGESELVAKSLFIQKRFPTELTDWDLIFDNWAIIRQYRNKAAHTDFLNKNDFQLIYESFIKLNSENKFKEFNDLKMKYKQ